MEVEAQGLNQEQFQASCHRDGPLLVLAGAGSGKTRIVTTRIVHLIKEGVPPGQILAVTFTNKAAQEMRERVHAQGCESVLICTFHSLGVRLLREFIEHLGFERHFLIYDEDDSQKLLKGVLEQSGVSEKQFPAKTVRTLISSAKNQLRSPDELSSEEHPWLLTVFERYQARLKEYNALDFDDLLALTVRLLREHPEVRACCHSRWSYLLVDEYQDTNHAQYTLARLLSEQTNNLFVVGDPDQSIYSWRGANIQNILHFQKDYPDARIVCLEQNYRSRNLLLKAANGLISHNAERMEKNLWSARGEGNRIKIHVADDERCEANFIMRQIHEWKKRVSLDEIVIFYRTNFQSRVLEDALLRERLPYVIFGGLSFYQRKEIKDLLAFLRLLHSPGDFISFLRTINLPKRGFGEATLQRMQEAAEQQGIPILTFCREAVTDPHRCKLNSKQLAALNNYVGVFDSLKESLEAPLKDLVRRTIQVTNYIALLKEDQETFEDRRANVEELVAKAAEWQEFATDPTLAAFLEELSLKSTLDEGNDDSPKVHLMTLHNGKGLEFEITFLTGMEEELFPHINAKDKQHGIEEERRLCYVGMTRAKEQLFLTCARSRYLWGFLRWMRPSRFLSEIPQDYLEKVRY